MSEYQEPSIHSGSASSDSTTSHQGTPQGTLGKKQRRWNPLVIILGLSAVFFVLFVAGSAAIFFASSNRVAKGKAPIAGGVFGKGAVGIVEMSGVIMDSKKTVKQLRQFEEDPEIKSVVLRLNSPGGSVAPSQEIYEAVKHYKKPVIASMASVAASGAYYIACGAKKIYANAGTITGSIGVIMEFANLEKLYEWAKIKRYVIKTGKFKDAGAEHREMTEEERALLQAMVDDVLKQFKTAVSEGRKLSMDEVTQVADGRIFSGSQAKEAKLVDTLGTLQDAIEEAAREGQINGKPRVIYPEKRHPRILDLLMDDHDPEEEASTDAKEMRLASWIRVLADLISGKAPTGSAGETAVLGRSPGIYWLWTGN